MAWTAPMTAVDGAIFTAAQFNTHVRDNLLETSPAKATAASRIFVSTGPNAIAERIPSVASVLTAQTTTAVGSFHDLPTVGPSVTVTTGTRALLLFQAHVDHTVTNATSAISVAISGATTSTATFDRSAQIDGVPSGQKLSISGSILVSLTPGTSTFKLQYYSASSAATFERRHLTVIPF